MEKASEKEKKSEREEEGESAYAGVPVKPQTPTVVIAAPAVTAAVDARVCATAAEAC